MTVGRGRAADWRDISCYRALAKLDRAALMWEWLRRDPAYAAWYSCASEVTRGGEDGEVTRKWGLHFRREPRSRRLRG
ncbi:transcriptional regulator domain-containing protein [Novosphingobium sp. BL-8A]|uniref:transcriptional regulator domain-containing protein n=1 Tax=Novosphingobium sp. BL-8A TaxID=3127639 RepID=UPI0037567DC5